ncbi:nucleotide pyrophosphohydrolase [Candidatus Peregrinibacteria bacterium]|nr:nucleotide pyrophosphohydrolase [Candidatus Peregrinibacteria bacterium]
MLNAFQKLIDLAKQLRSEKGCPWDKKQTIASLQEHFLNEAKEMQEAIEKEDYENLKEELGDVIFNIVMMVNIADEKKLFTMKEVLDDIAKKIIERHTWVFGDDKVETAEEAVKKWKENKAKKRLIAQTKK